jgi:hypothetical protein
LVLSAAPVWSDGDFYVVAVGGGVGTKITSLPKTINTPGFYYLTGNLSYSGTSNGITISSDDVTIDLMGFELSGPGSYTGIMIGSDLTALKNVEVRNGSLNGWETGLKHGAINTHGCRALNLRVKNCTFGILLPADGNLVKGCSVEANVVGIFVRGVATGNTVTNCMDGISGGGVISGNYVYNCSTRGISPYSACSVIGNMVTTTATSQIGIYINTSDPCLVSHNTISGTGTHYSGGNSATIWAGKSATYPYGDNAGAPLP